MEAMHEVRGDLSRDARYWLTVVVAVAIPVATEVVTRFWSLPTVTLALASASAAIAVNAPARWLSWVRPLSGVVAAFNGATFTLMVSVAFGAMVTNSIDFESKKDGAWLLALAFATLSASVASIVATHRDHAITVAGQQREAVMAEQRQKDVLRAVSQPRLAAQCRRSLTVAVCGAMIAAYLLGRSRQQ